MESLSKGYSEKTSEDIFDFQAEVITYADSINVDSHVMAALRTQSFFFSEIEKLNSLSDKAKIEMLQNQLDFFAQNNADLIERANEVRRNFVSHLNKQGFFN